tara:strand:- start:91 stop:408 length:318 start_codon:yes stop_codon:yes gene_type:complete
MNFIKVSGQASTPKSKMMMSGIKILALVVNSFLFGLIFTYVLPYIYNHVNQYTERGEDLDHNIDYMNSVITSLIYSLFIFICFMAISLVFGGFLGIATIFRNKQK